jgi:hypothetical protein
MTFAERASTAQAGRKGSDCTVGLLLESLPPDYLAEVRVALADYAIFATTIADILKADGYEIAPESLNRHRRNRCACR